MPLPQRAKIAALLLVGTGSGCQASRFAAAAREGSVPAYRRFLASTDAEGKLADEARRRLDAALCQQCVRADRPLAYRRYLAEFPAGRCAALARRRLAASALARARSEADLALVIEQHPRSPEARSALDRLAAKMAARALSSHDAALCRRFLAWFPSAPHVARVREHLADLEFERTPLQLSALEEFRGAHFGTRAAIRASQSIATIYADQIEQTGDPELLEQFAARFPRHQRLPQLRARARTVALRESLIALRVDKLEKLSEEPAAHPALAKIVRRCRLRPSVCAEVRALAARAAPWRPAEDVEALVRRLSDPDPQQVWRATAMLGRSGDPGAVEHIAALLGSARLDTIWVAERALRGWLDRSAPQARATLLSRMIQRKPHPANLDDVQRHAYLLLLAGLRQKGNALLERTARSPMHAVTARYLFFRNQLSGASPVRVNRLLSAIQARLRRIEQTFPEQLSEESIAPALLAERELFAITEVLADLPPTSEPGGSLIRLKSETSRTLASWRNRLRSASADFLPAQRPDISHELQVHEAGRLAAWRALRTRRDPASEAAAEALCHQSSASALSQPCIAYLRRKRAPIFRVEEGSASPRRNR